MCGCGCGNVVTDGWERCCGMTGFDWNCQDWGSIVRVPCINVPVAEVYLVFLVSTLDLFLISNIKAYIIRVTGAVTVNNVKLLYFSFIIRLIFRICETSYCAQRLKTDGFKELGDYLLEIIFNLNFYVLSNLKNYFRINSKNWIGSTYSELHTPNSWFFIERYNKKHCWTVALFSLPRPTMFFISSFYV